LPAGAARAGWLNQSLVTISGREFTAQDYRDWWGIWQDPGMAFYDTPQEFIDFHIMAEQARQMEIDLSPEFKRSLEVFLTVRALDALKNEEIDQKTDISEDQIRAFYEENYTPIWTLQILSYDEENKARAVIEELQKFNGQKAGRLVLADLTGVDPTEGGPVAYDEVEVTPFTIGKAVNSQWLSVISGIAENFVAPEPLILEDVQRFVVIRVDVIKTPAEDDYTQKRKEIHAKLIRRTQGDLTRKLLEKLKEKHRVKVNDDLLARIKVDEEYPESFLQQPVVGMDGASFSVGLVIHNVKQQRELRRNLSEEELKHWVVNSFVSNTVTNNEALGRHYEEKLPLKQVYEFYKNNTLRKNLEAGLHKRIAITEAELQNYYDKNLAFYSQPGKISYILIEENSELLNRIAMAVGQGTDFYDQAQAYGLDANIQTVAEDTINAEILARLNALQDGEVSEPFALGDNYGMVRMIERAGGKVIPFAEARKDIEKLIRKEKFAEARRDLLEKARAAAGVKVNQRVWRNLKNEYKNE
jgi:hypothetical protein